MSTEGGEGGDARPPAPAVAPPQAVSLSAGLHGAVVPFNHDQDDWSEYVERLEHYFAANDIVSADKQRAILLSAVGPPTYRLIRTLVSPDKVTDFTYSVLVEKARAHFNPKPSPIVKRYEFNTRRQGENEAVATYVAELRKIAEFCDYGPVLADMLRDRLVCGIANKTVQRRLLQEPALSFEKALDLALSAEAAEKDSRRLTGGADDKDLPAPVEHVKDRPTPRNKGNRYRRANPPQQPQQQGSHNSGKPDCYRCGSQHKQQDCPFKHYECHHCHKKGHLAKVCRQKKRESPPVPEQANMVEDEYSMFRVGSGRVKPLYATVTVNGIPLSMEVDTGASVSIISLETFQTIQNGDAILELKESNVRLQTYTGESIGTRGLTQVPVTHHGQTLSLPLTVTEGKGPTLLGRDWLEALRLDWRTIFTIGINTTLQSVLEEHSEVFRDELGKLQGVEAKIYVEEGACPRFEKSRPVPFAIREKVEEELSRLQALGVIQPVRFSDWAAPIVPVLKSDGRVRICGDYKVTINRAARLEKYPIPRIEELFASLAGGKTFSKLDLSHAYLQVPLDETSRRLVTINTHKGLFEYQRLPFGIASAPSIFQRVMENLLKGIPRVCVYLDDILVTGSTEEEHLSNLAQVLERLGTAGMRLKREKCAFMLDSVSYLGHVISSEGLRTGDLKVKAIVDAPDPKDLSELRSFLGMVNYYGKFLPNLATTLSPLYRLLRQSSAWRWGPKQKKAFRHVKKLLQSNRVLTHFDDRLPLLLECDASPYGLGAVLSHRMTDGTERPVCFASRTLTKAEQNYSHLDKEALAIIFGVKKYHQYLYGRPFEIKTDHKPLTHIFHESKGVPSMASGRIQRWALLLAAYDYRIHYRQGKANANADALSRLPLPSQNVHTPQPAELVHLMEHLSATPLSSAQIKAWTDGDPTLSQVRRWVQEGWPEQESESASREELLPYFRRKWELGVEEGCLVWGCRVVVPRVGRDLALQMIHEAHPGIVRMKSLARSYIWWPGLDKDIETCVKKCTICQSSRKDPPSAPIHPWPVPDKPWSRIHIDYAGPLEGKMFLLMTDAYSRWMEIHETHTSTSAATIHLLRRSFASLGLPEVIVSDNATAFTSSEFKDFLNRNGIRHILTPPYHPSSNGLVERSVQTFKEGLKRLKKGSLATRLTRFLFKYRITPHSSTGVSPAELMYGRKLRSPLDLLKPHPTNPANNTQNGQEAARDAQATPRSFSAGDCVYVRNYGDGPRWLPGRVVQTEGSVLYRVQLNDGRVQRRHIDQLRSRIADSADSTPQPDLELDGELPMGNSQLTDQETVTNSQDPSPDISTGTTDVPEPDISAEARPAESRSGTDELVPNTDPSQEVIPSEESPGPPSESLPTTVRRSTRVRQPPLRYDGSMH